MNEKVTDGARGMLEKATGYVLCVLLPSFSVLDLILVRSFVVVGWSASLSLVLLIFLAVEQEWLFAEGLTSML